MAAIKVSGSTGLVIVFVSQVIFGCVGFLALYVAAAALSYVVHMVNHVAAETAPWLPIIAPYIEMALFGVDLVAFALFTTAEVVRFAKALWQETR